MPIRSHLSFLQYGCFVWQNPSSLLSCGLRASHHITSNLNNLPIHSEYDATEEVTIENSNHISITHNGSSVMSLNTHEMSLNDILCVPHTCQNLLSIHSFIKHNNVFIEFFTA